MEKPKTLKKSKDSKKKDQEKRVYLAVNGQTNEVIVPDDLSKDELAIAAILLFEEFLKMEKTGALWAAVKQLRKISAVLEENDLPTIADCYKQLADRNDV